MLVQLVHYISQRVVSATLVGSFHTLPYIPSLCPCSCSLRCHKKTKRTEHQKKSANLPICYPLPATTYTRTVRLLVWSTVATTMVWPATPLPCKKNQSTNKAKHGPHADVSTAATNHGRLGWCGMVEVCEGAPVAMAWLVWYVSSAHPHTVLLKPQTHK